MNNVKFYIGYTNSGEYIGVTNTPITLETICKDNDIANYYIDTISSEIHQTIIRAKAVFTINVEAVTVAKLSTGESFIFDSIDYLIFEKTIQDISKIRRTIIQRLKYACGKSIVAGLLVTLSTGETKQFSFKLEDQINLESFVNTRKSGDYILYHADGEYSNTLYSYEDIVTIYTALYNNKLYNQIYTQVLSQWILNNLTLEMYNTEKHNVQYEYGYSNDEILEEVESIYEQQKLS